MIANKLLDGPKATVQGQIGAWSSNLLVFSFDPRCQGDRLHHQIRITRPSDGTIERRIRNSTKGWLQLRMRWRRTHKELEPCGVNRRDAARFYALQRQFVPRKL